MESLKALDGAGVSELADHLDMPKTTVHAHLSTLEDSELIANVGGEYRLGLRLVGFGEFAKNQFEMYEIAKDEVELLAEESGELVQFMMEEHGLGVYLHKAEPPHSVRTVAEVGDRRQLHCTALGKSILAQLPKDRVLEIVDRHGLPAKTENTITDPEELFEELAEIREQGYAVDDEEIQPGVRCIAAPVRPEDTEGVGAVSVSGPIGRLKGEKRIQEVAELVTSAANVIEINARNA